MLTHRSETLRSFSEKYCEVLNVEVQCYDKGTEEIIMCQI